MGDKECGCEYSDRDGGNVIIDKELSIDFNRVGVLVGRLNGNEVRIDVGASDTTGLIDDIDDGRDVICENEYIVGTDDGVTVENG